MSLVTDVVTYNEPKIVLVSAGGKYFEEPLKDYALFLKEAKRFGWRPIGVNRHFYIDRLYDVFDHEVDYFTAVGGLVESSDALQIAYALRDMIITAKKIINKNHFEIGFHTHWTSGQAPLADFFFSSSDAVEVIPTIGTYIVVRPRHSCVFIYKTKRDALHRFIKFCELGEFEIEKIS